MTDKSGHSAQPCILVIEDSQALRTSVVEVLTWEGFRVVDAPNGRQGLEALHAEQPDLVICDIMMPDLDGYGVLAAMRADPKYRTVPFIFLTALAEHADVRQGMELGAVDYLAKPFAMRDLLAAVRTQLRKDADYRQAADLRLEALSRQLITALPHELRTPLTSVLGYTELMLEDAPSMDPSEIREYLSIIHDAGERIKRLTENYLLYAQLEVAAQRPGALAVLRSQASPHAAHLVGAIAADCAAIAKRDGDLTLSLDEDLPPPAIGSEYLSRITEELVMNAFKFSPAGAPVHVSANATPSGMVMTVHDAGRGMSREQIAGIGLHMQFDRDHYEQQGTGMGLALVRRLVQLHEGRFDISSAPGEGTTVRIELPSAVHADGGRLRGVA
ncbi:MAG: response regulator [Anaerolineae bacterium]|nr:response regulator [Anaerolineae bacterium]